MVSTRSSAAATNGSGGTKCKALVTGGAGFLGRHVVQQLLDSGNYDVTVFDVREVDTPRPNASIVGDLRVPEQVQAACNGMDIVFHIATAAPTGENALNIKLMESVNVDGTRNIIDACVKAGVPKLVYTSSSSVVFDGRPLRNADESTPYAAKPMDYYTKTKILGEQMVLEANGKGGKLATVALRPAAIFGEGDMVFVPTVARNARVGRMKYLLGSGANMCDFTYAGNVAHAHLLAADALALDGKLAGKAYFITNQEPLPFWTMMGNVCEGLGYARPRIKLPFLLVIVIAMIFEYLLRPLIVLLTRKELRSDFTVNRILISTTHRTFSTARAAGDFGYKPIFTLQQALERTLKSFEHLRKERVDAQEAAAKSATPGGAKAKGT